MKTTIDPRGVITENIPVNELRIQVPMVLESSATTSTWLGFVTPDRYGAVGDGTTNDTVAVQAAINSGNPVLIPNKTYLVTGLSLPVSSTIFGLGSKSILKTTTNGNILSLSGSEVKISGITFLGDGKGSTYDGGKTSQNAISIVGFYHIMIENCKFDSLGGACVYVYATNTSTHDINMISNCHAYNCNAGVLSDAVGEYVSCVGFNANQCNYGFKIAGGNFNANGGIITNCKTGILLFTGSNDSHGIVNGMEINHCTDYAVESRDITNGFTFSNCHLYYGDIYLHGWSSNNLCRGIRFTGCTADVANYYFQWCDGIVWEDTSLPNSLGNTRNNNYSGGTSSVLWKRPRILSGSLTPAVPLYTGGYSKVKHSGLLTYTTGQLITEQTIIQDTAVLNSVSFHPAYTKYTFYNSSTGVWTVAGLGEGSLKVRANFKVTKNAADSFSNIYIYMLVNGSFYGYLMSVTLSTTAGAYQSIFDIPVNPGDTISFKIGGSTSNSVLVGHATESFVIIEGL